MKGIISDKLNPQALTIEEAETKIRILIKREIFRLTPKNDILRLAAIIIKNAVKELKLPVLKDAAQRSLWIFANNQYNIIRSSLGNNLLLAAAFISVLGENGEGLQIQVYTYKNGKEVLVADSTAEEGSDEYIAMEQLLNGEYKAKKGDFYIKISRTEDYDANKDLAYVMQIKQGEKYKHDYVTTEAMSDDSKNKTTSHVPMISTSATGSLSAVNALEIQATRYQGAADMLANGYLNLARIYQNNSKY